MDASVIVPCRNPGPNLRLLLDSLVRQDALFPWELLVVDNGNTDSSLRSLREFEYRLPLSVVRARNQPGAAFARNFGAERASSGKLLFIDADDEVASNYVSRLTLELDNHEAVTSRVDSLTLNPLPLHRVVISTWQEAGIDTFFNYLPAPGCNIGVRAETFRSLGGFPVEFRRAEDIAFAWRAQLSGVEFHFVPDTTYFYRRRRSMRALFRQQVDYGMAHPLLYKQFRNAGMPGRRAGQVAREIRDELRFLFRARSRLEVQRWFVDMATYVGRVRGSFRHRTVYV